MRASGEPPTSIMGGLHTIVSRGDRTGSCKDWPQKTGVSPDSDPGSEPAGIGQAPSSDLSARFISYDRPVKRVARSAPGTCSGFSTRLNVAECASGSVVWIIPRPHHPLLFWRDTERNDTETR